MGYINSLVKSSKEDEKVPFIFEVLDYREAEIKVKGWMLKKEILDGYRVNVPDPIMKEQLCEYWASAAFN